MTNNNGIPIENKKPFETVYEIKNEVLSFEEFMKTYEADENLNYDDLSYGDISDKGKGYGPCSDGRDAQNCYCSREELLRQRNAIITNVYVYNNIQQIINVRFPQSSVGSIFRLKVIIDKREGFLSSVYSGYSFTDDTISTPPWSRRCYQWIEMPSVIAARKTLKAFAGGNDGSYRGRTYVVNNHGIFSGHANTTRNRIKDYVERQIERFEAGRDIDEDKHFSPSYM